MTVNSATRSTGAEVAGSANSAAQYTYYRYCHTVMGSLGIHYFYIIWLPLRERQYAVVLQWLGCGQGQSLKAKAKADILWPQAKA